MAALGALVVLLGAMFAGALLTDRWRTTRLRAWADAQGLVPVDPRSDGGALLGHASRFATRVRTLGLTFRQTSSDEPLWIAEHRARTTTTRAEKWHTLVVVQVPDVELPDMKTASLDGWPHGGDIDVAGEFVRWRRTGLLWPANAATTIARGRELAAFVRAQRLGMVQK